MTLPDQYKWLQERIDTMMPPIALRPTIFLIGIRNKDNKRGIYDDQIILVTPDSLDIHKANTDPSITRKGVAVLQPGVYEYKIGIHGISHLNLSDPGDKAILDTLISSGKDHTPIPDRILPYWALRQAGPVAIKRDGQDKIEVEKDPNNFPWIDIHRGGYSTTSSLGCQTIHPDQWISFRDKVFKTMRDNKMALIDYLLVQA